MAKTRTTSAALGLLTVTVAATFRAAEALDLAFDCTTSAPLAPFWASVGYTPATYALRADELENTLLISGVPNRGVAQVRIHYLLDLVTVLGFAPSASTPSGWALDYDFSGLDFALDFLVGNDLMPGFEVMGSPRGFPSLPDSFWQPFNGNGHVQPVQTFAMFRQLVADVAARCVARYGAPQVAQWHWESWNEPDQGCKYRTIHHSTSPTTHN
jgi:L-iduronidase